MLNDNNAAVGLATRRLMQGWRTESLLDEAAVGLMTRALNKSRACSPAGWVFMLGELLGAPRSKAFCAGSVAELFHAAVDLVDDIQDGEADAWLPDVPASQQLNTALHLVAVSSMAAARIEAGLAETLNAYLCAMLTGQGREMARRSWSFSSYVDVSNRIAGRQIALYLHAASAAAGRAPGKLLAIAEPLALLLMIRHDQASADDRLLCFEAEEIDEACSRATAALREAIEDVPEAARPVVDRLSAMVAQ